MGTSDKITAQACEVADQFCLAAGNLEDSGGTRARCFGCGGAVCRNCSITIAWHNLGPRRICHNCIRDQRGDYVPAVFEHLYRLAGYPAGTGTRAAATQAAEQERIRVLRGMPVPARRPLPRVPPRERAKA